MAPGIPFSTKDLKNKNTKAEYIGLDREDALRSILRSHVATKMVCKMCQSYVMLLNLLQMLIKWFIFLWNLLCTDHLLVVFCLMSFALNIFASPKSEILAFKSLSSSILLALISRCTILIADSSCRYARPFAIPRQILCLVPQSSLSLYCSTEPSNKNP